MSCFSCFSSQEKRASKRFDPKKVPQEPMPRTGSYNRSSVSSFTKTENTRQSASPEAETSNKNEAGNGNIVAQTFTFRELASATKNFRPECLVGEGGFGRVYKGRLNTGQMAAVKQLDRNGLQGNKEFLVEVLMLSLLHHDNLVNLIGYCADGDQRLLVYEYMPLGSLEDHLLEVAPDQAPLSWHNRMKIAFGAAKGLEYLHETANPPVIYRDLKSSNILLHEDYSPKLSDFGLAKLGPIGDNIHVSSRVMGTYGYCAPEYVREGQLTSKSDVYSFGVVLLELIAGRRAIDTTRSTDEQNLVTWALPMFKDPRRFSELGDPRLQGDYPERSLNQAIAVAAMCLQDEAATRPNMADVVVALSFLAQGPKGEESSGQHSTNQSVPSEASGAGINSKTEEESDVERQRAVAEAIQWGSNSRHKQSSRSESVSSEMKGLL